MNYSTTGRLFYGISSSDFFEGKRQSISKEINSKSQNELLKISIEQYAEYLYSIHLIDFPLLDDINYTISSYEGDISASRFPVEFAILDRSNNKKGYNSFSRSI